jgi:hypothetical protein
MSVTNPTLSFLAAGVLLVVLVPVVPDWGSSLPQAVTTAQDATRSSRESR